MRRAEACELAAYIVRRCNILFLWIVATTVALPQCNGEETSTTQPAAEFQVLAWNIWNGGDEARYAEDEAVKRAKQRAIIDVIRASGADVVALVETYGSGEAIAAGLGFHFHPRGTNVSLLSRWPIVADVSVYKPFNCVGAVVQLPDRRQVAVYAAWIHYVDDIWTDPRSRDGRSAADLLAADGESRMVETGAILSGIDAEMAKRPGVPVILAGDFNSNSHLDYVEAAREQYGIVAAWPVTKLVADAGFRDAYRVCRPRIDRAGDRTWSPRFPEQIQDRIDFIFWRGAQVGAVEARRLDRATPRWPSDHAAVWAKFRWE
ncbi:Endonuclease/Exonuclease/phosphatase family protein [Lacipirellula limnantheis]|uniref:Endonuclease/Exonuclease/phosphatase family protein n=1 Tax=Lacipirellula limnantheis TaxID=2528024 RepID=A0A517U3M4_9BACT|nr:Endonuclease/Exonuclease/phosphatase family protein [Lacipirellula limnantheis]